MLRREAATGWIMLPSEHVSLTARSDLRELHRGALPQTRAVKEGCEASAGTHVMVGWEAQRPTARKAAAEPTGQSKRLWMIFPHQLAWQEGAKRHRSHSHSEVKHLLVT